MIFKKMETNTTSLSTVITTWYHPFVIGTILFSYHCSYGSINSGKKIIWVQILTLIHSSVILESHLILFVIPQFSDEDKNIHLEVMVMIIKIIDVKYLGKFLEYNYSVNVSYHYCFRYKD